MHITWDELTAIVPTAGELAAHAAPLAAAYNDPHNAALLGHTSLLTADDVRAHYAALVPPHGYGFLLLRDGALAGDGDLRGIDGGEGEFAFLITDPHAQGKGLGTRFATMVHAFAFGALRLDHVYATVIPANAASLRVFEKLGYVRDDGTTYGDEGDIVLRADRDRFLAAHAAALAEIAIVR